MTSLETRDSERALSPRELEHLRRRDRKRTTAMVVDNAGVKRVLQAQRRREEARRAHERAGTGTAGPGGRSDT